MEFSNTACDLNLAVKPEWVMLDLCVPADKTVDWIMS